MEALQAFFERVKDDARLGPMHISLYTALLDRWLARGSAAYLCLDREELMRRSKIMGKTSYYRCLKELAAFGLMEYWPEYYPGKRSRVRLGEIKTNPASAALSGQACRVSKQPSGNHKMCNVCALRAG